MTFDANTIRPITARIVDLLETKCVSLNGHDVDWRALFAGARDDLESGETPDELERCVTSVLERGGLSHVAFFHNTAHHVPARYAVCATFMKADTEDGERWMFQDVHEGGPAHEAGLRSGDVLLAVDGTDSQPPVAPRFRFGEDAVLTIVRANGIRREVTVRLPKADPKRRSKGTPPMAQPTALTSRKLEQGIGYVRVAFFPGASGQPFAAALDRALATLADCDRLAVDLRGNWEGS